MVVPAPQQLSTPRFRLDVLDMPGHCAGHLCLWELRQRWLLFDGHGTIVTGEDRVADLLGRKLSRSNLVRSFVGVAPPLV
jgi:glyoxylase-like metal-dependent hydrolase (beta-lactamase superfamily II)